LRALCLQVDPELFFPPHNGSSPTAARVCRGCPVRVECLAEALAAGDRFGIRAGLSGRQRRTLVRRRAAQRAARAAAASTAATVVTVGGAA
jgi:WhiB family redox-sensing transcriptional regulator